MKRSIAPGSTPRHPAARRAVRVRAAVLPLVGLLGAASLLGACGTGSTSVLTIDGEVVTADELESDLTSYANAIISAETDPAKRTEAEAQFHGTDKDKKTWNGEYTAFMLQQRLIETVFDQEFKARKLPTAKISTDTKTQLEQSFGNVAVYKALSEDFRNRVETRAAQADAIQADIVKSLGTPQAYFTAHESQFQQVCASHILVATQAEADAIEKQLAGGGDFAAIAKAKSTDTGSGAQGGDLGCTTPDTYVAEFAEATKTLEINKISEPVQTQFGFHIIKVTKRQSSTYAAEKSKIADLMKTEAGEKMSDTLIARLKGAKVKVDPAYGTYVVQGSQGFPEIQSKTAAAAAAATAAAATADTAATGATPSSAG